MEKLRKYFRAVTDRLYENYVILNPAKCHYMCFGKNREDKQFEFEIK